MEVDDYVIRWLKNDEYEVIQNKVALNGQLFTRKSFHMQV